MDKLKKDGFARYSRQIFIEEIGVVGQRKIAAARVLVIGAGGLGSPVIQYLAAAGVGTIAIADFDRVELHNLNRQIIHAEERIGQLKVDSAKQFVRAHNSTVQVAALSVQVTEANAEALIQDYDIIIDGSDNFETRYVVNDTCVALQKPLVYGSIFAFEGQVAVFNYRGSKHLRQLYPEAPPAAETATCDRYGVLGPLPGIVGSMMAMQVLKISAGLPVQTNTLTLIDALNWQFRVLDF